jgi:hypothetical protein
VEACAGGSDEGAKGLQAKEKRKGAGKFEKKLLKKDKQCR